MLKPNNPYQVNIVVIAIIYNLSYSYYKGQKCEHFDTQQNITLSLFKQKMGTFWSFRGRFDQRWGRFDQNWGRFDQKWGRFGQLNFKLGTF